MKVLSCKIGTVPAFVVLKAGYKVAVGRRVWVRDANPFPDRSAPLPYYEVLIDRVNPDGYFFASRV